jgi:hypothetical protein
MNRDARHVLHAQTVSPKELVDGGQREVAQMLVVNGVELASIDQVFDIRNLDDGDPRIFQDGGHPADHPVQVGHMSEHVVCVEDVGLLPSIAQAVAKLRTEEFTKRWNSGFLRRPRDIARRLDAEHRDSLASIELEQVSIVTGDLDDEAAGAQRALRNHLLDQCLRMANHRVRVRGEVEVFAEEFRRRHGFCDLDQCAVVAEREIERIPGLRQYQLLLREQRVRQRRGPK